MFTVVTLMWFFYEHTEYVLIVNKEAYSEVLSWQPKVTVTACLQIYRGLIIDRFLSTEKDRYTRDLSIRISSSGA